MKRAMLVAIALTGFIAVADQGDGKASDQGVPGIVYRIDNKTNEGVSFGLTTGLPDKMPNETEKAESSAKAEKGKILNVEKALVKGDYNDKGGQTTACFRRGYYYSNWGGYPSYGYGGCNYGGCNYGYPSNYSYGCSQYYYNYSYVTPVYSYYYYYPTCYNRCYSAPAPSYGGGYGNGGGYDGIPGNGY